MPDITRSSSVVKSSLGLTIVATGTILLLSQAGLPGLILDHVELETWGQFLAGLPALGMTFLRESIEVVFSRHAYLTAISHLLLSFWPLILVGVGVTLLLAGEKETQRGAAAPAAANASPDRGVHS